jgi:hypothetical protein
MTLISGFGFILKGRKYITFIYMKQYYSRLYLYVTSISQSKLLVTRRDDREGATLDPRAGCRTSSGYNLWPVSELTKDIKFVTFEQIVLIHIKKLLLTGNPLTAVDVTSTLLVPYGTDDIDVTSTVVKGKYK